jgi:hypothetical protein
MRSGIRILIDNGYKPYNFSLIDKNSLFKAFNKKASLLPYFTTSL